MPRINTKVDTAIADADVILKQPATGDDQSATFTRLWTWITAKFVALSTKNTIVDADGISIIDSEASNAHKAVTFTKTWTWIQTKLNGVKVYFASSKIGLNEAAPDSLLTINSSSTLMPTALGNTLLHLGGGTNERVLIDSFGIGGGFYGRHANGTAAAPTTIIAGTNILGIGCYGYDGAAYSTTYRAAILLKGTETWDPGAHGTSITFITTPKLDTAPVIRMVIEDYGGVRIGDTAPSENTKTILKLDSTTRGFLPPRLTTTQRDAIATPPAGLTVYNSTTNKLNFYNGSAWEAVTSA